MLVLQETMLSESFSVNSSRHQARGRQKEKEREMEERGEGVAGGKRPREVGGKNVGKKAKKADNTKTAENSPSKATENSQKKARTLTSTPNSVKQEVEGGGGVVVTSKADNVAGLAFFPL